MSEASLAVEGQSVPAATPPAPLNPLDQTSIGAGNFSGLSLARWTPVVNRFLNDLGFPGKMPRP
jgi:hypothetical protein